MTSSPQKHSLVVAAAVAIFAWLLWQTAWMSDDAYITLRTVDNAVNGFGLRWNVVERVQAYTHPAWMALQLPFYALTRDAFLTPLFLQATLSIAAFTTIVMARRHEPLSVALVVAVCLSSKALMDYSTSGLENPLVHLGLVGLAVELARPVSGRSGFRLGAWVSLLVLSRLDLVLLVAPALLLSARDRRLWRGLAAGLMPIVAWEAFSLVYYGVLVPNTAFAKLGTGYSVADTMLQGMRYWKATWAIDPVTPLVLVAAAVALSISRDWTARCAAMGAALYGAYTVYVGGDFMSGRFFTAPIVWLCAAWACAPRRPPLPAPWAAGAAVIVFVVGAVGADVPPWRSDVNFGEPARVAAAPVHHGVSDERRFYYESLGLSPAWRAGRVGVDISHDWAVFGRRVRAEGRPGDVWPVRVASNVGLFGFHVGPDVHVIDRYGLSDPVLARLPSKPGSRIGHFERAIPDGYVVTRATGINQLADPRIAELYDRVALLTQAPLMSSQRWREIVVQLGSPAATR